MSFLIYKIRSFILLAIILPLFVAFFTRFVKALGGGNIAVITSRTLIILVGLIIGGSSIVNQSESELLKSNALVAEAAVIQNDFANNKIYGDKKYDLGTIEFSPLGLIKAAPIAIFTGVYRPVLPEALSLALLFNGVESTILLFLSLAFIFKRAKARIQLIRTQEFLLFSVVFVFIIAFMTGLTSGLYGVLVRLRAPLLPFVVILLTLRSQDTAVEKIDVEE